MDLESKDDMFDVSSVKSPVCVKYVDSPSCINDSMISNGSASATLTISDGTTLPITLVVSEVLSPDDIGNSLDNNNICEASEGSLNIVNAVLDTQYIVESLDSVSQSLYTIKLPDKISDKSIDMQNAEQGQDEKPAMLDISQLAVDNVDSVADISPNISDIHVPDTTTRLEEFMDVVTTYKCKFCRFSCPWKSGLMSHIRNCHLEASKKMSSRETEVHNYALSIKAPKSDLEKRKKVAEILDHGYSQQSAETNDGQNDQHDTASLFCEITEKADQPPPVEKHVFLCGQCSKGFGSFEECKHHMVKDHKLKLSDVSRKKETSQHSKRGRGRPRARTYSKLSRNSIKLENSNSLIDEVINDNQENVQKRLSRTPKNLEEDYYLECKRRRIRKDNLNDKPFRCNEKGCGYRFSSTPFLHYHSTCHSIGEKPFLCPECQEYADHWRGLAMHLWKEHTVDIDLYTCGDCGYKTCSHFKLDNHKKIHSDERGFVCNICKKGFKQRSQLRNHVVIHTDRKNMVEKRWYSEQKCEICNRIFSDSKCLRKHQQAVHSKLKPYVCTYCGHMSARKAMLQLHMRQHTGEKPFLCEHCEYRTGDHNSLRRHRMRHTGTKPYKCPHCPYACIQAISYKTHLKNKHPGLEGLYACDLCAFRSVNRENYDNHMSDHKRGVLPTVLEIPSNNCEAENIAQESAQMHLSENTLQQLEGMLPGNITAAQLIYSCLNALSQEGGTINLPPGVTTASAGDGTQTITIQLPANQTAENEQIFFTIQPQENEEPSAAAVVTETENVNVNSHEQNVKMEILQPISIMQEAVSDSHSLDSNAFVDIENEQINSLNSNSTQASETQELS